MHNSILKKFIESNLFENIILACIISNAVILGLMTSKSLSASYTDFFTYANNFFLAIFAIEISLKLLDYRQKFFYDNWNIFDFFIVLFALIIESSEFSLFRAFRIIRILRLFSVVPKIRLITQALLKSSYSMLGVAILLLIIFYVYAVLGTHLYSEDFPQYFGSFNESFYTFFQIMTFDSWSSGIVRPLMEAHPYSWILFISFLLIVSYIILNIAIGIVVDCIGEIKSDSNMEDTIRYHHETLDKITHLEQEIIALKELVKSEKITPSPPPHTHTTSSLRKD
ncbi:ion transporter [Neisseria animalis]|uniref:ion transporter n=1 Tax=Neisseria animalis TaxID=492 RepID=UPI000F4E74CD|nr:ion transporter [Neisseria animalis]ROW32068.1 ion transporter [Neisseria animalis]